MDVGEILTIDRNHMDMVRFASTETEGYLGFKRALEAWLPKATERAFVDHRYESQQRQGERIGVESQDR
jgi:hypothetical protein